MSAGYHHFIIEQGATFAQTLTLKDANDTLIDLTGFTGSMHFRQNPDSDTTVLDISTTNGRMVLNGTAGTLVCTVSATDTAALTATDGIFDCEVTSGGGIVTRLIEGTYSIRRNITR
tara:strand:+ start:418 stop:768 length:351 start_codon:yes stop_codon:yes gene_type:complete